MALLVEHLGCGVQPRFLVDAPKKPRRPSRFRKRTSDAITHVAGFGGGDGRAWPLAILWNACFSRLSRKGASGRNTRISTRQCENWNSDPTVRSRRLQDS